VGTAEMVLSGFRGLHLAALLSLTGVLAFITGVAPPGLQAAPAEAPRLRRDLWRLAWWSLLLALSFGAIWFVLQAAAIGGTSGLADTFAVLWPVAWETQFGKVMVLRFALLLATLPLIGRTGMPACALVGLALSLQGAVGHAGALDGSAGAGLLASEALHLLAAGLWLGSLLPLLRSLAVLPPLAAAAACRRFSPVGMAAVLILAGSGMVQGFILIGNLPGLFGTAYGQVALLKMTLFGLMLVLAMYNRLTLTDRLTATDPALARRRLRLSIMAETALAALLVAAAVTMASLTPAAHEQPLWPFSWQPSLAVMADPDLRQEVMGALLMVGAGVMAICASLVWRRGRIAACLVLVAVVVIRLPSLELLVVEAYPTSFYVSPTGFAASGIVQGQTLFATSCAGCHGAGGNGDGPAGAVLRVHPADLTAAHLLEHPDGELFWWLSHGMEDPEGGMAMPGFAAQLTEAERWSLIDFIRANNAGTSLRLEGRFRQPVPAPSLPVVCADPAIHDMSDLHGRMVLVTADGVETPALPVVPSQDAIPVAILHLAAAPTETACAAETPDAWRAYAVLTGVAPAALAGTSFLIDPDGWLRTVHRPADRPDWNDPEVLRAEVQRIRTTPLSQTPGGGHDHHHE
jgi:putative copper export protein/mono/diheme cytochrome c family protein